MNKYEQGFYRDIMKIAKALEKIAANLEKIANPPVANEDDQTPKGPNPS